MLIYHFNDIIISFIDQNVQSFVRTRPSNFFFFKLSTVLRTCSTTVYIVRTVQSTGCFNNQGLQRE